MAPSSARNVECPARPVHWCNTRFAVLIRADRGAIIALYSQCLAAAHSPVMTDPRLREEVLARASEIVLSIADTVDAGCVPVGQDRPFDTHPGTHPGMRSGTHPDTHRDAYGDTHPDAYTDTHRDAHCDASASQRAARWRIARPPGGSCLRLDDVLNAVASLSKVVTSTLATHVDDDSSLLSCLVTAMAALSEEITNWISEVTQAYTGHLLDRVQEAHVDERRRIARELHDRLGTGLCHVLRQFDLREICGPDDPVDRVAVARETLAETARQLRLVTSDLRQEPMTSLEKALARYLESAADDAHVRLRVIGDEAWVPPVVIDQAFLVIREAIRNALTHGAPRLVLIAIEITAHELCAWVEDDGQGFLVVDGGAPAEAGGSGLISMRERVTLIGGELMLESAIGRGTRVEFIVPLPGHRHE